MSRVIAVQNEKTPHDLSRKNYIRNTKRFIKFCREKLYKVDEEIKALTEGEE